MLLPFCCGRLQNSPYFFLHVCLHAWAVKGKFRSEGENRQWDLGETPQIWTVCFSLVKHLPRMSRTALCALQNWFWEEKKNSCFAVCCCGQTWNSWNYYLFFSIGKQVIKPLWSQQLIFFHLLFVSWWWCSRSKSDGSPSSVGTSSSRRINSSK